MSHEMDLTEHPKPILLLTFAILQILSGIFIVIFTILKSGQMKVPELINASKALLIYSFLFLGALNIGAGIGTVSKKKLGWWLGAIAIFYAVIRAANGLYSVIEIDSSGLGIPTSEIEKQSIRFLGKIFSQLACFAYYFKSNVLAFFDIQEKTSYLMAKTVSITIAITGINYLIALIL